MAKQKFILTADLVTVEPEPQDLDIKTIQSFDTKEEIKEDVTPSPVLKMHDEHPSFEKEGEGDAQSYPSGVADAYSYKYNLGLHEQEIIRDQFNLKIDRDLKRDFRVWCLNQNIKMTYALEEALRMYMYKNGVF